MASSLHEASWGENALGGACMPLASPSERLVLDVVRRHRTITRAAITAEINMAQQSVHRLVEQLLDRSLLEAGEPVRNGRGQPSPAIMLRREAAYSIGVAVSTDAILLCLADFGCALIEHVQLDVAPTSRDESLTAIHDAINDILQRHGVARANVIGVCLAIPCFFVHDHRQVNAPEPLRDWSLIDLAPIVEQRLQLPVWIENSATTAAIGESLVGAGLWARSFFYLSFNYGLGGGVVIDGKPFFGTHGNAGDMQLFTNEEMAHRPALQFLLRELQSHGINIGTVQELRAQFNPTWPGVTSWLDRVEPALNRVVNSVAGLFDPQAIVFGGQLPVQLGAAMIERVSFWKNPRYGVGPSRPQLVLAEADGDPSAIGAALVPLKNCFFT